MHSKIKKRIMTIIFIFIFAMSLFQTNVSAAGLSATQKEGVRRYAEYLINLRERRSKYKVVVGF